MFEGTNLLSMECRRRCPYDGSQTRVNQGNRKLLPGAKGPFKVTAVLPNDRYELHDLRDLRKSPKQRNVVAVDSMRRWVTLDAT